ncbi:MAG: DUF4411 family protein [Bacteroidales bacterium]|nr:DUF4411 family protein [Bacteroidales bacterium]
MYIIDTNIFITSKNTLPMDVWTTFWSVFGRIVNGGSVYSIEEVGKEINRGKDALTQWVKGNVPKGFFIPLDADIMQKYSEILGWARSRQYTDAAINDFAQVADSYLVATAAVKGMTVVTYEKPQPNAKKRVLIPDVCNAFGVPYCDLNDMLRGLGETI